MSFYLLNIIENEGSGLGNQIYNMAGMLDYAIEYNIKFLFVGKFLKQIYTQNFCNSEEIFDFDLMNKYFGEKYGVYFFDGNTCNTKINITYNSKDKTINITDIFLRNFLSSDGNLFVSQNISLKNICDINDNLNDNFLKDNDTQNYIVIQYFVNNFKFETKYPLKNFMLEQNIYMCITNKKKFNKPKRNRVVQCVNPEIFYDFFANLEFSSPIKNKSLKYFESLKTQYSIKKDDKINCIHLRLEEDLIKSLANEEKCSLEHCKSVLEKKYIHIIEKYFNKNDIIIILAHNFNNEVINYLKNNGYKYILTDNLDENRDVSAAIDLTLGSITCNNIFMLYFQSTFSFILMHKLKNKIKQFLYVNHYINDTSNEFYYGGNFIN